MIAVSDSLALEENAAAIAADIRALYPALACQFMVHRRGQRQDAIHKTLGKLGAHPAADAAKELLHGRNSTGEQSAFLGVAIGYERSLFRRKGKAFCLAFVALNIDQYDSREEAQYALYGLTCQFLDMVSTLNSKTMEDGGEIIVPPKRVLAAQARTNMKADIFSVLMMQHNGTENAVQQLAKTRGMQPLLCQVSFQPEEYPFAISVDVTEFAAKKLKTLPAAGLIRSIHQLATDVTRTFERQNIESWVNFTKPAQTMAWAGNTPEQILGASIHSSPNPFIKSIGNLLAEVTGVQPAPKETVQTAYNPFVDIEINQIAHDRQVEDTFEMVMIHSMEADSSLPLMHVANNQNESITKGKMLGWCSHALQSAAKAYDNARVRGAPAMQAARLEFESAKHQTNWDSLNRLNEHIIEQRRLGYAVTLSEVATWCKSNMDLRPVMESINYTLADPAYARKLAMANEMPTPDPSMIPQAAPSYSGPSMAPSMGYAPAQPGGMGGMGGMGGGMMSGGVRTTTRPTQPPAKTETTTETNKE